MAVQREECINMKHSDSLEGIKSDENPLTASVALASTTQVDLIEKAGIVWTKPNMVASSKINLNTSDTRFHNVALFQDYCFDFSWFKTQSKFLEELTDRELFILKSYTKNGDEFVNALMKIRDEEKLIPILMEKVKILKTPLANGTFRVNILHPAKLEQITEQNVINVVSNYANELIQIFKKAPPVTTPLRVFRGISPPKYTDPVIYPMEGITSTTYNPFSPLLKYFFRIYNPLDPDYVKLRLLRKQKNKPMLNNCCVFDIILRPGVRAIWLEPISNFPDEQEIALLPSIVQASYSHPKLKLYEDKLVKYKVRVQVYDVTVNPIVGKTFTMKGGKTRRFKSKHRKTYKK